MLLVIAMVYTLLMMLGAIFVFLSCWQLLNNPAKYIPKITSMANKTNKWPDYVLLYWHAGMTIFSFFMMIHSGMILLPVFLVISFLIRINVQKIYVNALGDVI